ncbi:hypothetical protein SOVF_211000 [Spinacia oleracea]|uniref:Adenylate isopentenyltransferase-like n=1 Tax=Spinacia oleracea TaxID=3562 RepID=A0A9R0J392_SPIOL|nr:adenylate isopentenyltransferase-like [Spinacia oleracea]KNA03253.1 hypothetical protein SOVF_211000 [Spinacia oleracea]
MRLSLRSLRCNSFFSYATTSSLLSVYKLPTTTVLNTGAFHSTAGNGRLYRRRGKEKEVKAVVILGPTGSGKSGLSIELGTCFPFEVINSDKIQVYKGLDITTNKIPMEERLGVPHHLIDEIDSEIHGELTPAQYRARASSVISGIAARGNLPLVVGGSNSLIYALLAKRFSPDSDVFNGGGPVCSELRFRCCFLWIDVSLPVLNEYLAKRVDDMLDSGMVNELAEFYESGMVDELAPDTGLTKAIGVPEFERYFRYNGGCDACKEERDRVRRGLYDDAVRTIKENTCQLAKTQIEKIQRLRNGGWRLHRIDGTETFRAVLEGSKSRSDIWNREVVEPSMKIVKRFLEE